MRRLMWFAHWTATLILAAAADLAAPLPFTGPGAGAVGVLAAAAICLIGHPTAPPPGEAR
jgi:hypothetical protein